MRRIASNYIWTRERGFERHPVAEISAAGEISSLRLLDDPDREPFTEFYSGVLVAGFPLDERAAFAAMLRRRELPLEELLRECVSSEGSVVVISGLDYERMRLTPQSCLLKIR